MKRPASFDKESHSLSEAITSGFLRLTLIRSMLGPKNSAHSLLGVAYIASPSTADPAPSLVYTSSTVFLPEPLNNVSSNGLPVCAVLKFNG